MVKITAQNEKIVEIVRVLKNLSGCFSQTDYL